VKLSSRYRHNKPQQFKANFVETTLSWNPDFIKQIQWVIAAKIGYTIKILEFADGVSRNSGLRLGRPHGECNHIAKFKR